MLCVGVKVDVNAAEVGRHSSDTNTIDETCRHRTTSSRDDVTSSVTSSSESSPAADAADVRYSLYAVSVSDAALAQF